METRKLKQSLEYQIGLELGTDIFAHHGVTAEDKKQYSDINPCACLAYEIVGDGKPGVICVWSYEDLRLVGMPMREGQKVLVIQDLPATWWIYNHPNEYRYHQLMCFADYVLLVQTLTAMKTPELKVLYERLFEIHGFCKDILKYLDTAYGRCMATQQLGDVILKFQRKSICLLYTSPSPRDS